MLSKVSALYSSDEMGFGEKRKRVHTVHANLAFILEITLVRDDDDRELIHVLHSEDLLVEGADFLERVSRGDGVNEQEALSSTHVLLTHRTEKHGLV